MRAKAKSDLETLIAGAGSTPGTSAAFTSSTGRAGPPPQKRNESRGAGNNLHPRNEALPVVVNPPLDFELKNLDPQHPYLSNRGFTAETVKQFGLGFCNRGSLKDRVAIPLHDMAGKLIGYAGRVIDDKLISEANPKYLFPSERERDGKLLQFRKSLFVYNGWRIEKPVRDLIVVEGFASTWWLTQHGAPDVVALMGSSCSIEQGALITKLVKPKGSVWVMTDGDDAGRRCAGNVFVAVGAERLVRYVKVGDGQQPTDWSPEDILGSFGSVKRKSGQSDEPTGASLCEGSTTEVHDPTAAEE